VPARPLVALCLALAALSACEERPPPPVVAPKPPAPPPPPVDADTEAPPPPLDDAPGNVLQLPEHVAAEEATEGDGLIALMLDDPARAERALHRLPTPDGWQVALMANFTLKRGERAPEAPKESQLPALAPDAGVPAAGADAWVAAPTLPLEGPAAKKGRRPTTLLQLPINTRVTVDAVDGARATVTVEVASEVEYGETGSAPTRVVAKPVQGTVDAAWLARAPVTAEALVRDARAQPDTPEGRDAAVVLWHRALLVARSELAREGLLRAAWQARRPSWVVAAALTRNFAPARSAAIAFGCRGDVARAKWLPEKDTPPKKVPDDVCLTDVDARPACDFESKKRKASLEKRAAWRQALGVTERPLLRLVVDAREPRAVLLAGSHLAFHDSCAEFEEVDLESHAASLRRLVLPLGTKDTVLRVPVPQYHGWEYAVLSAPSETRAGEWMRSRSRYRWTIGRRGELQVSLQPQDQSFELEPDASGVTVATPPARHCECNDD